MASRTLFLAALAVLSCADASWLPWTSRALRADEVPKNDFNISKTDDLSKPCLRLSAAISIEVDYENTGNKVVHLQVPVPHLPTVIGSCGPDPAALLSLSWGMASTTAAPEVSSSSAAPEGSSSSAAPEVSSSSAAPEVSSSSAAPEVSSSSAAPEVSSSSTESGGSGWNVGREGFDVSVGNSLTFNFKQQDGSYFLADIAGGINIDADDIPANSKALKLAVAGQKLFEAPSGSVSKCSGSTLIAAQLVDGADGSIKTVSVNMTDVEMLAYYDKEIYPTSVKSCHSSATAPKMNNAAIFVLGSVAALLANLRLW